jgi:hypothetical protein
VFLGCIVERKKVGVLRERLFSGGECEFLGCIVERKKVGVLRERVF